MLYGRTLFGGALNPRQVTAAGSAVCVAGAQAQANAALRTGAGAFATASVATGVALRTVLPATTHPVGVAVAQAAQALVDFSFGGAAAAGGVGQGRAQAEFSLAGGALSALSATGRITRTIRYPVATRFRCFAGVEAGAVVYVLADLDQADCRATPFGTYWEVGYGQAPGVATPAAGAQQTLQAAGHVAGGALAAAAAQVDSFAAGESRVSADADPDSLHTASGVRYWSARAVCPAIASFEATPYVYSVALAVGRAWLVAGAQARRAARVSAVPRAVGSGHCELVLPEQGTAVIHSDAQGAVVATLSAKARTQVGAAGAAEAGARVVYGAGGEARASGVAESNVVWLTTSGTARPFAGGQGRCHRASLCAGQATVIAFSTPGARKSAAGRGQSVGLSAPTGQGIFHPKIDAQGSAQAVAQVTGSNTTNEAAQRLSTRVVRVGAGDRLQIVPRSLRLVQSAGQVRRVAA